MRFTYNYSLLIKKDICDRKNISNNFLQKLKRSPRDKHTLSLPRWSLQFLVRVFTFLSLILWFSYFSTFLSTWSNNFLCVCVYIPSGDLFIFRYEFSISFPIICVTLYHFSLILLLLHLLPFCIRCSANVYSIIKISQLNHQRDLKKLASFILYMEAIFLETYLSDTPTNSPSRMLSMHNSLTVKARATLALSLYCAKHFWKRHLCN